MKSRVLETDRRPHAFNLSTVSTRKPIATALLTFAVVAGGVFAALQVDRFFNDRKLPDLKLNSMSSSLMKEAAFDPSTAPIDFRAAVTRITPSVVSIDTLAQRENFFGDRYIAPAGSGSGVVISDDGYVLTNNHVVASASAVRVSFVGGRTLDAKVVGTDPRSDLAVLKVKANGLKPIEFGRSDELEPGQWVIAVGNPLGFSNTVSVGVVSSVGRTLPTQASVIVDAIQTDAAINPGNSGGALCNAAGQLVGINTAIASRTGGSEGIGFAIPVARAKRVVDEILRYGRARYGMLGLNVDERAGLLGVVRARQELKQITESPSDPPSEGLLVQQVIAGGPAAKIGLRQFDVLLSLDGKKMADPVEMQKVMIDKRPGDKVAVRYWSRGKVFEKQVTVADLGD